jgi:hypothetical protein
MMTPISARHSPDAAVVVAGTSAAGLAFVGAVAIFVAKRSATRSSQQDHTNIVQVSDEV